MPGCRESIYRHQWSGEDLSFWPWYVSKQPLRPERPTHSPCIYRRECHRNSPGTEQVLLNLTVPWHGARGYVWGKEGFDSTYLRAYNGHKLNQLTEILIQRLEKKGVEQTAIPGFIRNLANIISVTPHMNLREVNRRLHLLGWTDFELDDHTLQLTIASFEVEALKSSGNEPGCWFDTNCRRDWHSACCKSKVAAVINSPPVVPSWLNLIKDE